MIKLRERDIEAYLISQVKKIGGEVRKLKWIARANAPDRVVLFRGATFVELKAPGKVPRPAQAREFERLESHGAEVYVLSTLEEVDAFIEELMGYR